MKVELLIVDANVLIDFCDTDRAVLRLVVEHVGAVHVAQPVLDEVDDLTQADVEGLGLLVVQPELPLLIRAGSASVRSPLRFQDWVCLLLAQQESWTCVTNDKRLRVECQACSVSAIWGLELLLRLVQARAIAVSSAITLAEAIHAVNRRIPKQVLAEFVRKAKAGHQ